MNTLLAYDAEELEAASNNEEHNPEVRKALTAFIQGNHQKYTLYQLSTMLHVTPSFIQSVLTPEQLRRVGRRPAATILILRDYDTSWEEDSTQWLEKEKERDED